MLTLTEKDKTECLKCLKELNCCLRCILRFLGIKSDENPETYLHPNNFLENIVKTESECFERDVKKVKTNPCRACLDILEDRSIENFILKLPLEDTNKYKYPDYQLVISLPKTFLLRDKSMFCYLKDKFPGIYTNTNDLESVKKIFRVVSNDLFSKKMGKNFSISSKLKVNLNIQYEDDEKEMENIRKLKSYKSVSRNFITDIVDSCTDEAFKLYFPVPPEAPDKPTCADITLNSEALFLGGRYLKFSRVMGQTPWIINNKPMTEYCLQDVLFDSVSKTLGFDKNKMTFSASGREDADVRMLGNGRPFYIQIQDPKSDEIPFEQLREIETDVLKSGVAAVLGLQKVDQVSIKMIKDGEELKRKHYFALCITPAPNVEGVIRAINVYNNEPLEVDQKTPLRVLHRRTLAVRKKTIYSMKASPVPGHCDLIYLDLVTQAGTYVKEFVNSDFHRTHPSLTSIIEHPIDVVALDVTKVELEWP